MTANTDTPTREQRIANLRAKRGYFAGFGQTEKVKAVDIEIAKLRAQGDDAVLSKSRSKRRDIETATADVSSVESASIERR
jgi:hypothetical protein